MGKVLLNEHYFKLKVRVSEKCCSRVAPGHFAHIQCTDEVINRKNREFSEYNELKNYARSNLDKLKESHILLRRPFSIHDAYSEEINGKKLCTLEFLIRRRGAGTDKLSKLKKGDKLDILAPIGNPFNYKKSIKGERHVLIVAGGIGIAPFKLLCKRLINGYRPPAILFGFEEDFSLNEGNSMKSDLTKLSSDLEIASNTLTKDGNDEYHKGFVTQLLEEKLKKMTRDELDNIDVYSCGPHLMLKEVQRIVEKYKVNCEISMEEKMACGIGACAVCVCKIKAKTGFDYKRVCVDGPVFNSKEIIFD
ncbi:dihydroorotate dehydrogenase electron transfer subunit [Thermodesulfobacteriota bacterium]